MYVLEYYDKETEEFVVDFELPNMSHDDVLKIFGFALRGNCAEVSQLQLVELENSVGDTFPRYDSDMFICEVSD